MEFRCAFGCAAGCASGCESRWSLVSRSVRRWSPFKRRRRSFLDLLDTASNMANSDSVTSAMSNEGGGGGLLTSIFVGIGGLRGAVDEVSTTRPLWILCQRRLTIVRKQTRGHVDTWTRGHTPRYAHAHTPTHTPTHTHANTHTHTHTHTHRAVAAQSQRSAAKMHRRCSAVPVSLESVRT